MLVARPLQRQRWPQAGVAEPCQLILACRAGEQSQVCGTYTKAPFPGLDAPLLTDAEADNKSYANASIRRVKAQKTWSPGRHDAALAIFKRIMKAQE